MEEASLPRSQSPVMSTASSSSSCCSSRPAKRESNSTVKAPRRKSSGTSDALRNSYPKPRNRNRSSADTAILNGFAGDIYDMESEPGFGEDEDWTTQNQNPIAHCRTAQHVDDGRDGSASPLPRVNISKKQRKPRDVSEGRWKTASGSPQKDKRPCWNQAPAKKKTALEEKPLGREARKQAECDRRVSIQTAKWEGKNHNLTEYSTAREYSIPKNLSHGDLSDCLDGRGSSRSPSPSPCNSGCTSPSLSRCTTPPTSRSCSPSKSGTPSPAKSRGSSPPKSRDLSPAKGPVRKRYAANEEPAAKASPGKRIGVSPEKGCQTQRRSSEPQLQSDTKYEPKSDARADFRSSESRHSSTAARKSILKCPPSAKPEASKSADSKPILSGRSSFTDSRRDSVSKTQIDARRDGVRRNLPKEGPQSRRESIPTRRNSKTVEEQHRPSSRQSSSRSAEVPGPSSSQSGHMKDWSAESDRGRLEQQVMNLVDRSFQREKELENICAERDRRLAEMNSLKEELESWKMRCMSLEAKKSAEPALQNGVAVDTIVEETSKWTKLLQAKQSELNTMISDQKLVCGTLLSTRLRLTDMRRQLLECKPGMDGRISKCRDEEEGCEEDAQALALDLEAEVMGLIEEIKERELNFEMQGRDLQREKEFLEAKLERTLEDIKHRNAQWESEREHLESMLINKSNKVQDAEIRIKMLQDEVEALSRELHFERTEKHRLGSLHRKTKDELGTDAYAREIVKHRENSNSFKDASAISKMLYEYGAENSKKDKEIDRLMDQMAGVEKELREVKTKAKLAVAGFMKEAPPLPPAILQKMSRKANITDPEVDPACSPNMAKSAKHVSKEELLADLRSQILEAASLIAECHGDKDGHFKRKDKAQEQRQESTPRRVDAHKSGWEHELRRLLDGKDSKTADTLRALSGVVQELELSLD